MVAEIVQFMALAPAGDAELHRRHAVHRLYEEADPDAWLRENAASVRVVITSGHQGITDEMVGMLPRLGMVAIAGVGYERVNLPLARARGLRVTNTPEVLTEDVADCALGLMIAALRRIPVSDRFVREGRWGAEEMPLTSKASGRRYGILGLGRIGLAIARRLEGFGGTVAYTSREPKQVAYGYHGSALELARHSDILFVTAASTPTTRHAVDGAVLDALGPTGVLVNVARGALVDEDALVAALTDGRLGGAALDVYADEPNVPEALLPMDNVVLSPHVGSATVEAREAMALAMLENLDAFLHGREPPTPVV